jgi:uncharacterized protein (TIGR00297 family)
MIFTLLIVAYLIAILAFVKQKLTRSGMIAACIVGTFIVIGLHLYGLLLLGLFFISSTLLSSLKKESMSSEVTEKGGERDFVQVLANGGISALLAFIYLFFPSPIIICGFVGSLAAANSDTWASELGAYSKKNPVHLLKGRRVEAGTSGAMTALGTAAAIAGSFLIAVFAIFFWWGDYYNSHILLIVLTLTGFLGHFLDSLLGALWQVLYRCSACFLETERKEHCGQPTVQIKGRKWINNDIVNMGCTTSGAIIGIIFGLLIL